MSVKFELYSHAAREGMKKRHFALTGVICSVGLPVSPFVAELAFKYHDTHNQAKLEALITVLGTPMTIAFSRLFR